MLMFLKVYLILGIVIALIELLGLDRRETSNFVLVFIVLMALLIWPYHVIMLFKVKNMPEEELDENIDFCIEKIDELEKFIKGES